MRAPASTYRLQITADFDLFEAARTLPYLHDLGVDWVYLSPLLAAEPGSDHGYDVVDHDRVDAARGGAEGLAALSAEARRLGHGRARRHRAQPRRRRHPAPRTPWWWDVLTHGRGSRVRRRRSTSTGTPAAAGSGSRCSATTTWRPTARSRTCAVVDGELRYHDHRFPLAPGTADDGDDADDGARPAALRAGQLAARPTPS